MKYIKLKNNTLPRIGSISYRSGYCQKAERQKQIWSLHDRRFSFVY